MKKSHYLISLILVCLGLLLFSNISTVLTKLHHLNILDKTGHFFGFLLLTWLIDLILKINLRIIVPGVIIYAILTEVGQHFLTYRSAQFTDVVADSLGCITYAFIVYIYRKFKRFEA